MMTKDEARRVIIAACFQDASGETNYIENAIRAIEQEHETELIALWHFSACPFDHCQRCIEDEPIIKRIRDRLGSPTNLCMEGR